MWWFRNTSGVLLTRTVLSIRVESGSFFSKIKHHLTPGGSTVAVTLAWMAAEQFLTFGTINQCCEILLLVVKQCLTSLSSATAPVVERGPNSPSLHLAHIYIYMEAYGFPSVSVCIHIQIQKLTFATFAFSLPPLHTHPLRPGILNFDPHLFQMCKR